MPNLGHLTTRTWLYHFCFYLWIFFPPCCKAFNWLPDLTEGWLDLSAGRAKEVWDIGKLAKGVHHGGYIDTIEERNGSTA